ncbi:APC family permease [Arthrobacter terricola]|uniref:APC family permease n=2 Tax=Arthrobacter TaxID=1663 RepID=A0A4R5KBP5_9MICC|nr:APC family permease [Arthrobacter terricola]
MATKLSAPTGTTVSAGFQRRLGYWSLVGIGIGSVIGSGWLFSAMYAAQGAGPSALISWVIGGTVMLALSLVVAELGMTFPESGGTIRYPLYSNGKLAAGIIGWCTNVGVIGVPALEASGVMQYASSYVPGLYAHGSLTLQGIIGSALLLAVFTALNYFGVTLFARSNNIVTTIKIVIPILTLLVLIISGLTSHGSAGGINNFADGGGFAPYGLSASLGVIATAGILFAYNGAQAIVVLSGEARNPRKDIPAAMITTIVFTIVLYLGLQLAFIIAAPHASVLKGWGSAMFDSPFGNLALIAGIQWLYWILVADAAVSPSGSAIVAVAALGRTVAAMAKNGFLPSGLQKIDEKWGIPRRALALNFVVGLAFLLPLPSWHAMIGIIGVMIAFTFGIASVSVGVFRRAGITRSADRICGVGILAPITFSAGGLIVSWVPWAQVSNTFPILAIGIVLYAVNHLTQKHGRSEIQGGAWLLVFFGFLYAATYLGSTGIGVLPAPWDTVVVFLGGLAFYRWGTIEGLRYMKANPDIADELEAKRTNPEPGTGFPVHG